MNLTLEHETVKELIREVVREELGDLKDLIQSVADKVDKKTTIPDKASFKVREVANLLNLDSHQIRRWVAAGQIKGKKDAQGSWTFPRETVELLVKHGGLPPVESNTKTKTKEPVIRPSRRISNRGASCGPWPII